MGDSGSQLIGFTLASLGLASSYTVASSTLATLLLPVIILAVPILDTTLVTIVRLLDGRPITQGGKDPQGSHRLVALGVSETSAVIFCGWSLPHSARPAASPTRRSGTDASRRSVS